MLRVPAELEDIPLGDSHVLKQRPGRERKPRRLHPAKLHRQAGDCFFKIQMRAAAAQQVDQVLAQGLVISSSHGRPSRRMSGFFRPASRLHAFAFHSYPGHELIYSPDRTVGANLVFARQGDYKDRPYSL